MNRAMKNSTPLIAASLLAAVVVAGCAALPSSDDLDREALAAIKAAFRDEGIAKVDRIQQDLGQAACSSDKPPPDAVAEQVMAQARGLAGCGPPWQCLRRGTRP